jgi:hypothetical protein
MRRSSESGITHFIFYSLGGIFGLGRVFSSNVFPAGEDVHTEKFAFF